MDIQELFSSIWPAAVSLYLTIGTSILVSCMLDCHITNCAAAALYLLAFVLASMPYPPCLLMQVFPFFLYVPSSGQLGMMLPQVRTSMLQQSKLGFEPGRSWKVWPHGHQCRNDCGWR